MLVRLTYASRATQGVKGGDIRDILAISRRNNVRFNITGVLCFSHDTFLQCLEGGRDLVNQTYNHILGDKRHDRATLLDYREISSRRYRQWAMAYVSSLDHNRDLFLKYAEGTEFDPYALSSETVDLFLAELLEKAVFIDGPPV